MLWKAYNVNTIISVDKIYSFFDMDYEENYDFGGETHNFWECVYVSKGELCVTADERVYNLTENQIIFHKPMECHKFRVTGKEGARLVIFSFSLSGELCSYFVDKVFMLSSQQIKLMDDMLEYAISKKTKEGNITEKYLYAANEDFTYMQTITTYMHRLFLSLAENKTVSDISHAPDATVFGRAVDYMNSNIEKNLTVTDISKFFNISESGLKRCFLKYAGIGVHKYFMGLKIKAATELLKSGVSVSETAVKLGFSSQGYFSRVYKRETGTTPKLKKK